MAPLPQHDVAGASETADNENPTNNYEESPSTNRKRLEDLGYGVESFHTIIRPGKKGWIVSNTF